MKTLIKLFTERRLENLFSTETFLPEHTVYLCPPEIAARPDGYRQVERAFAARGLKVRVSLLPCSRYDTAEICRQLETACRGSEDCAIDLTGGTDAAIFACGMLAKALDLPAFTYSRRSNCFYGIHRAPFDEPLPCTLRYTVEQFFLAAGGHMRPGRVDNDVLAEYLPLFDRFFDVFLQHKDHWNDAVVWMQRLREHELDERIRAKRSVHLRGSVITLDEPLALALQEIGMLRDLRFTETEVCFRFVDEWTRTWLRDVGSVLELYIYKACIDSGLFHDVVSSAVVDWDSVQGHACVTNEIDAVAARGVTPLFISCKVTDIKTTALNELAILRDRFGGKGAKALIVTTEPCVAAARHRAAQLGITVIDPEELSSDLLRRRLRIIMDLENGDD